MRIKKNKLIFIILFIVNLIIASITILFLPNKFFGDSYTIISPEFLLPGFIGSYEFSQRFYELTLLKFLPFPLIALIQYPILIYLLYKIGVPKYFHTITVKNILVYIAFFMLAIFVSMPSKEFITFIYISLIPFVLNNNNKTERYRILLSLFLIMLFGSFFRIYYMIIPIVAVGMYLITFINIKNRVIKTVLYGVLISIFLSLSAGFLTGKYISQSTREELNYERKNSKDANSMIVSPVATDTWYGEVISVMNGFIAVNIPVIEGLKHILSPQIIAFIIWQLFVFYILLKRFSRCIKDKKEYQMELWAILILLSYYIVQGLFEPDLGTATRHKIGFFPLIYFIFYYENFRKDLSKSN